MKKTLSVTCYTLFALYVFFPAGTLLASLFGYTFSLFNYTFFAVIIAAMSLFALVLVPNFSDRIESKTEKALFALLPVFVIINWIFYIFESAGYTEERLWVIVISMLICFACSAILAAVAGRPVILKAVSILILLLAVLPLVGFTFLLATFGSIGVNTVVDTIPSPEGTYYAEIVDSDQGALGGNTIINVCEKGGFDAFVFTVRKAPRRLYTGRYGEYKTMEIYWKNEHCLVINSEEYRIK